jgi:aspartate racemase
MKKKSLTIGILGGMGPAATVDIFSKIVKFTPAATDQDHIRIIIDNNPKIPNRIAAFYGQGADPSPAMIESARSLEAAGADFIIIPCNTAHLFMHKIEKHLKIPFLSIIDAGADFIKLNYPQVKKAGILGTTPTVESGLYRNVFAKMGIALVSPESELQHNSVMEAIFGIQGIKAGNTHIQPRELLIIAAKQLAAKGAEIVLMACTEIPIVLKPGDIAMPLVDLNSILAMAAVSKALGGANIRTAV